MRSLSLAVLLSLSLVSPAGLVQVWAEATPAPPVTSESRKTAVEWLAIVRQQTAESKTYDLGHPEDVKLLRGVAAMANPYFADSMIPQWPVEYQDGYKAFMVWWQDGGKAAFARWRQAGFPVRDDRQSLIFHVLAFWLWTINPVYKDGKWTSDASHKEANSDLGAYVDRIGKRGFQLLQRGYAGEAFSAGDMAELRLFAMYVCQLTEFGELPPNFHGWMTMPHLIGDVAPELTLPSMDQVLARPGYREEGPTDELNLFRPCILERLLNLMNGYQAAEGTRKSSGDLVEEKPYDGSFAHPVTLSSFRGKKPVLFMCEDATDTWCWSGTIAPLWEPLYEAIKDKVEIFFIHTTVHDTTMNSPGFGFYFPGGRFLHATTLEQRAFTAKMCYMYYPTLSMPFLLDDLGEHALNAFLADGGGCPIYLLDRNGRVTFLYGTEDIPANYGGNGHVDSDSSGPYALLLRNTQVMNLVESNVKNLLDAGGVWNNRMKRVVPDWQMLPTTLSNIVITAVDLAHGQIATTDSIHGPHAFMADGRTRILEGIERRAVSSLKNGQTVSIYYQKADGVGASDVARLVTFGASQADYWNAPTIWVPARVLSIDRQMGVVQVRMTEHMRDSKGLAFWKNPSKEMTRLFGSYAGYIAKTYGDLAMHEDQPLSLRIDRATDIFIDGSSASLDELKIGDVIGADIPDHIGPEGVWPHFIRVYRY